jgi:Protein of unknown function (DUF1822)
MVLLFDDLTQIELQISPDLAEQAWRQSQSQPTVKGQWNAYLNQMCLQTFIPWLQAEHQAQVNTTLNQASLSSFWAFTNGTAITWNNKRLILIPEKSIDNTEYTIPQEWLDIPKLVGDYYLAVQINPSELSMRVWGYTTHEQIKTKGTYNAIDRTYSLDAEQTIQDLSVLWVVSQLNPNEQTRISVPTLSPVPTNQAENLLSRLTNLDIIQPRLEIPFSLWGELFADDNWRQRLYQQRQQQSAPNIITNLSQWLQNTFEDSWQSLDNILLGANFNLNFSLRATDNDTSIKRVKSLNLPNGETFLILELEPESDGRIGIRIQLRTRSQEEYLLPQTNLKLLSASGQIIQSVQARTQDNIIQLKRFKTPTGTQFTIQIDIDGLTLTENCIS